MPGRRASAQQPCRVTYRVVFFGCCWRRNGLHKRRRRGRGEPCSGARPTTHIRQYGALGRGLCLDGRELCVFFSFFALPFLPSRRLFPDWDKTLQGEGGRFFVPEDWGLLCRTCDYLLPCRDLLRDGELPTWAENPAGQRASKQIKSIQNPHLAS